MGKWDGDPPPHAFGNACIAESRSSPSCNLSSPQVHLTHGETSMSTAGTASTNVPTTTEKMTQKSPNQHAGQKRPAPRGTAAYPRKRAITACQVCRARRTKCDNLKPSCSFCLKSGAQCIQSSSDLSSFDPASLRILDRLDELERLMLRSSTSSFVAVKTIAWRSEGCMRGSCCPASIWCGFATEYQRNTPMG